MKQELDQFTLRKFLQIVWVLDVAKQSHVLDFDPTLFNKVCAINSKISKCNNEYDNRSRQLKAAPKYCIHLPSGSWLAREISYVILDSLVIVFLWLNQSWMNITILSPIWLWIYVMVFVCVN